MGGLGKSSLAARLCDRLPEFERVVWVGPLDEPYLVNRLTDKLDDPELRKKPGGATCLLKSIRA